MHIVATRGYRKEALLSACYSINHCVEVSVGTGCALGYTVEALRYSLRYSLTVGWEPRLTTAGCSVTETRLSSECDFGSQMMPFNGQRFVNFVIAHRSSLLQYVCSLTYNDIQVPCNGRTSSKHICVISHVSHPMLAPELSVGFQRR